MFFKNTFKLLGVCFALLCTAKAMEGNNFNNGGGTGGDQYNQQQFENEGPLEGQPQQLQQADVPGFLVTLGENMGALQAQNGEQERQITALGERITALEALAAPEGVWSKRLKYTAITVAVPAATYSFILLLNGKGPELAKQPVITALIKGWESLISSYPNLPRNLVIFSGMLNAGLLAALRVARS